MDFEEFRFRLEKSLIGTVQLDLQEYQYLPYSFGDGLLVYTVNGIHYRIIYDGKDRLLSIDISALHQKYSNATWTAQGTFNGLNDGLSAAQAVINKSD